MLLADRFKRISAPAAAPAALGGEGTHRSSQISIWNVNGASPSAAKIRSEPNGASCPATVIDPPRTPSPDVKCRRS